MGLFDRLKKQKNTEVQETQQVVESPKAAEEIKAEAVRAEEPKQEVPEAAAPMEEKQTPNEEKAVDKTLSDTANEGKRFTLMVDDAFQLQENQGVVIVGNVYGSVEIGDAVYVIHPSGAIGLTKVDALEVGPGRATDKAENERVAIRLTDIKDKNQVPKYTVLTGIRPQTTVDADTKPENPQLLGLSMDYMKLYKEQAYLNLLIYVICHAHYVVPVSMDTTTNAAQPLLRFPSLQNPANPGQNVFPVFTDEEALDRWKNIFDEKHPKKTTTLKFPDIVSISNGTGIVINPFGPSTIMLPPENIEKIVSMEGYKQEFGANAAAGVKKADIPEGKIVVGVPKEDNEIKMIREAIAVCAKNEPEIKRVDFLLKVDVQQERSYLCVVDCPEEQAPKLFASIQKAAAPFFKEVQRMEFLLNGKSKLANDVVSEKSCIYQE